MRLVVAVIAFSLVTTFYAVSRRFANTLILCDVFYGNKHFYLSACNRVYNASVMDYTLKIRT